MRKVSLICFALLLSLPSIAQKFTFLRGGVSYSNVKDADLKITDGIGFFAGVGLKDNVNKNLAVMLDVTYSNQRTKVDEYSYTAQSIDGFFGVNIFLNEKGPYLIVGPQFGHSVKIKSESTKVENDIRFNYVAGLGCNVIERVAIEGRFVGAIDNKQSGYNYAVQVGLNFRIN
jgi:outer membrane protein W